MPEVAGEGIERSLLLEKGSEVAGPINDDPGFVCCASGKE